MKAGLRVLASVLWLCAAVSVVRADAPAQRLPSALLIYPYIVADGVNDTRIELLNLSRLPRTLHCFFVDGDTCSGTNFYMSLTPNQPISWLASQGTVNNKTFSAAPPFFGTGELKCLVEPPLPDVEQHNTVQGRAIVFGSDGQTVGYSAVGFQRLSPGEVTDDVTLSLDGSEYAQCPDELRFAFLASNAGSQSEIILVPCSQDLLNVIPTRTTVQFKLINEFEQVLSASLIIECFEQRRLEEISNVFREENLGTVTGQVVVRGVQVPLLGMIIDRFSVGANAATAANEPFLRGGRSATVSLP